jgi:hypothetical protein
MIRLFVIAFLLFPIFSKMTHIVVPVTPAQEQGAEGYVYRVSGNQMPSPNLKPTKPKGVLTTLYIYELTNISQVSRRGQTAFYQEVKSKCIRKLETEADGHFSVLLPTGSYSFFTKKDDLFYANWFDDKNNIAPVLVSPGKLTRVEIRIDYDANY